MVAFKNMINDKKYFRMSLHSGTNFGPIEAALRGNCHSTKLRISSWSKSEQSLFFPAGGDTLPTLEINNNEKVKRR